MDRRQGRPEPKAAIGVPLRPVSSLNLPEVSAALGTLLPRELPRTGGGMLAVLPALALTGGGLMLRQTKRRRQR